MNWRFAMLAILLLISAGNAQSVYKRDFSADMVTHSAAHETTGRFYESKGRLRMETLRNGSVASVMILDPAMHTAWQIMPQQKTANDMSTIYGAMMNGPSGAMFRAPDLNNPCASLPGATCEKQGEETVNGRRTQKWLIKEASGRGMTLWLDPSLPAAIKTEASGYTAEMRNIKEGPQADSLFQVPSDYKKTGGSMPH